MQLVEHLALLSRQLRNTSNTKKKEYSIQCVVFIFLCNVKLLATLRTNNKEKYYKGGYITFIPFFSMCILLCIVCTVCLFEYYWKTCLEMIKLFGYIRENWSVNIVDKQIKLSALCNHFTKQEKKKERSSTWRLHFFSGRSVLITTMTCPISLITYSMTKQ